MTNVLIFDMAKSYSNCYHLKKNDAISYDLLTYENQNFTVTLICNHVSQSKSESGSKKYNTSPTYKTVTYYVNAQCNFFFFLFFWTHPQHFLTIFLSIFCYLKFLILLHQSLKFLHKTGKDSLLSFNWVLLHAKLNNHYEAWSYKKKEAQKD